MKPSHRKGKRYAPKRATFSITLPEGVRDGLDTLADREDDSRNNQILLALVAWLEQHNVKLESV